MDDHFFRVIYKVANFLQTNDIAHNFFMTRGSVFNSSPEDGRSTIRAYFWPRKSFTGWFSNYVELHNYVELEKTYGFVTVCLI